MALHIGLVLFFQKPVAVSTWAVGNPLFCLHSLSSWTVQPARAALLLSCGSTHIGSYIQSPINKSITNSSLQKTPNQNPKKSKPTSQPKKKPLRIKYIFAVLLRILGYRTKRWKSFAIFHLVSLPKHKAELFPSSVTCRVFLLYIKVVFITYLLLQSHWDFHVTVAANEVAQFYPEVWPRQLLGLLSVFLPANHHWLTLFSWRDCSWIQKHLREEL